MRRWALRKRGNCVCTSPRTAATTSYLSRSRDVLRKQRGHLEAVYGVAGRVRGVGVHSAAEWHRSQQASTFYQMTRSEEPQMQGRLTPARFMPTDRKSTRLNSSHLG